MNNSSLNSIVRIFLDKLNDQEITSAPDILWNKFLKAGTTLWLDTGDIDGAKKLWNKNFTALTTNNTLLNKEVQKGIYDEIISEASDLFKDIEKGNRIKEIALLLNALHGSRLARIFNAKVSVELHTDLAHDIEGIEYYGTRLFNVNPDHFIIKVPFTAEGLIGARILHDKGIPVNFTLMFSARQNVLAALIAQPAYSNVFLGRIGAFLKNNNLGEPDFIGEKVTNNTQYHLNVLKKDNRSNTRLIAASIRNWKQLTHMEGIDVFTMPVTVATDAKINLNNITEIPFKTPGDIILNNITITETGLDKLWKVDDAILDIAERFNNKIPSSGQELIKFVTAKGLYDIFPDLNDSEIKLIDSDGKIPVYNNWASQISQNKTAIDSLLNLAGLYAFKKDQAALDNRIKEKLTG